MNCAEVNSLLAAHLHGEVTPAEHDSILFHLALCDDCQQSLASLKKVDEGISIGLRRIAQSVEPSDAAWGNLLARIEDSRKKENKMSLNINRIEKVFSSQSDRRLSLRPGMVLLFLLILALLVPPAWAMAGRLREWLGSYYSFKIQDLEAGLGGFTAFKPYYPSYVPKGFNSLGMGGNSGPGWDQLELTFSKRERFVTILQAKGLDGDTLPDGEVISINGQPGIFLPDFINSVDEFRKEFPTASITTDFNYSGVDTLVWFIGEIKIELITNLTYDQAIKIAESLVLMESTPTDQMPSRP